MEENVALVSSNQKKFDKSIKGIKKLIKKTGAKESKSKSSDGEKVKSGRVGKKKRKERGLVYLAHIPHGFYEHEMTQYFKQFGVVTNARVIKSKRTGRSKGFAFVEFKDPSVAQIVAETMNNYLMGKRLIKASYIPPEKQKRRALRKHWNSVNNPGNNLRLKMKKAHNEDKDEAGELQRARKMLSNVNKTKRKLLEMGINYDFFTPVDVPLALQDKVKVKDEDTSVKRTKGKTTEADKGISVSKNKAGPDKNLKQDNKQVEQKTLSNKKSGEDKKSKNPKKGKLDSIGVKPLEDFINIQQDSDSDSESLVEFDSDEFEKSLQSDDDIATDEETETEESDDEIEMAESDESEEELPKSKKKQKSVVQIQLSKETTKKNQNHQKLTKRQAVQQKPPVAVSKKPKYEKKSNQVVRNKQFKKKK